MAEEIRIEFTRFSAFYSPLIATMAGGFLKAEGLEGKHSVSPPGQVGHRRPPRRLGACGAVGAAARASARWSRASSRPPLHFAQINEKDGFFLTGRSPDPAFSWDKLKGRKVSSTTAASRWPCSSTPASSSGLDFKAIQAVDAGSTDKMIAAFRAGEGDFIHLQGPAPQQLEHDKVGHVVAAVGDAIGPCAFSSLAATREWLATDMAKAFMRAYRKARAWLLATPAAEVAKAEAPFFHGHRPGGADRHHRHLPEARQLDPARGDHPARLRGDARHLPARRADHQATWIRGRGCAATGLKAAREATGARRVVQSQSEPKCRT